MNKKLKETLQIKLEKFSENLPNWVVNYIKGMKSWDRKEIDYIEFDKAQFIPVNVRNLDSLKSFSEENDLQNCPFVIRYETDSGREEVSLYGNYRKFYNSEEYDDFKEYYVTALEAGFIKNVNDLNSIRKIRKDNKYSDLDSNKRWTDKEIDNREYGILPKGISLPNDKYYGAWGPDENDKRDYLKSLIDKSGYLRNPNRYKNKYAQFAGIDRSWKGLLEILSKLTNKLNDVISSGRITNSNLSRIAKDIEKIDEMDKDLTSFIADELKHYEKYKDEYKKHYPTSKDFIDARFLSDDNGGMANKVNKLRSELINELKELNISLKGENKMKKLKSEAIYLVTPDENGKVTIDLDDVVNVVDELTDTVKETDATEVAGDAAEEKVTDAGTISDREMEVVDVSETTENPEEIEIVDELQEVGEPEIIDISENPDATDIIMDAASVPGDGITSDVQASEMEPVPSVENANGPLFVLAEQLISAFHTVGSLHRNLTGGAWFDNHEKLEDYAAQLNYAVDEIIEQNIALGGREPSAIEALNAFSTYEICGRDKNESYRIVREVFNAIVSLMEECKSSIPGDTISKIEEMQNYFRKEAEYKIAKTVLGEVKLMTREEMKRERILENKLSDVKNDAMKEAIESGKDQYLYKDGEDIYYTDESPKTNPDLFENVELLGSFITDSKDGKTVAKFVKENLLKEKEYVSTSKFKKRVNEEKIGEVEIQDSMDYVGKENNPELEEIAGDKISFKDFMKDHKEEVDLSYKNTYGDEMNKDLYDALADYMYNDSLTGNVQTKEDYVDPIEETDANKGLVNDEKNKDEHKEG